MTNEPSEDVLLSCPFCNSAVEGENLNDEIMGEIACYNCDITMNACAVDGLVKTWNTRTESTQIKVLREALKYSVHDLKGVLEKYAKFMEPFERQAIAGTIVDGETLLASKKEE